MTRCSGKEVGERDRDSSLLPLQTTEVCLFRGTLGASVDRTTLTRHSPSMKKLGMDPSAHISCEGEGIPKGH